MPVIDFSQIKDEQGRSLLPDGTYLCRVLDVVPEQTKAGDECWRLDLEVIEGDYAKRRIFDRLVFSEKALPRVKFICSRLGLDTSGEVDLRLEHLLDRIACVTVFTEEIVSNDGLKKKVNKVPWDGYTAVALPTQQAVPSVGTGEGDVPF